MELLGDRRPHKRLGPFPCRLARVCEGENRRGADSFDGCQASGLQFAIGPARCHWRVVQLPGEGPRGLADVAAEQHAQQHRLRRVGQNQDLRQRCGSGYVFAQIQRQTGCEKLSVRDHELDAFAKESPALVSAQVGRYIQHSAPCDAPQTSEHLVECLLGSDLFACREDDGMPVYLQLGKVECVEQEIREGRMLPRRYLGDLTWQQCREIALCTQQQRGHGCIDV
jgi:hypothetical protein